MGLKRRPFLHTLRDLVTVAIYIGGFYLLAKIVFHYI
jgi:hypothetical protein